MTICATEIATPLDELTRQAKIIVAEIAEIDNVIKTADMAKGVKVIELGNLLSQIKKSLPHGQWYSWIEQNLRIKPRNAQNYMTVAEKLGKCATVAHLGFSKMLILATLPHSDVENFLRDTPNAESLSRREFTDKIKAWKSTPAAEMNNLEPVTIDVSATSLIPVLSAVNAPKTHFQPPLGEISLFPNLPAIPAENQREYLPPINMILAAKNIGATLLICRAGHVPEISAPSIVVALGTWQASWISALASKASALIQSKITFRIGDEFAAQKSCVILYFGDAPETFASAFVEFGFAYSPTKQKAPTS